MNPERWQRIEALFQLSIEQKPENPMAYLESICTDDSALRAEVEALLIAHEKASHFIEKPVFQAKAFAASEENHTQFDEQVRTAEGKRIGAYKILREIGRGGMGNVYLATRDDDEYRKQVAIKLIKRGFDSDFILQRFKNERQILASLEHTNIARLLDGGSTGEGLPYLVMEYVEGIAIDRYCDAQKLSTNGRLQLFRQVCSAVHYAHQNLVIHRDLKPSNILVTQDGTPKLLDFGIAKLLSPNTALGTGDDTETAMRLMTPNYASPEQVKGERVTTASDIYSLGVLLYELLTGHRPYRLKSRSATEILQAVLQEEPEKPSTAISRIETVDGANTTGNITPESVSATREGEIGKLKRSLIGDIDNIVLMALRKEPQRRYASVEQFSEDLRRHLEGLPVIAHKDTVLYRSTKFIKRNKVAVFAALLIIVAIVIGFLTTMKQQTRAERRFSEVRKLAHSVIFDYHDAIADLQGATPVRERLVKDALEYLNSLSSESSNDTSLKMEIAEAYKKIGDVQGNPYQSNLGDTEGSLESYRKALAILELLVAQSSDNNATRISLAQTHSSMGDVLWELNHLPETLKSYETACDFYRPWSMAHADDVEAKRTLARLYSKIGDLYGNDGYTNLGRTSEAQSYYRQSLALREELVGANPNDNSIRKDLYESFVQLADFQRVKGDQMGAEQGYRKGLEIMEALVAADPENISYQIEIANTWSRFGLLFNQMEKPAEAIPFLNRAIKVIETAATADPLNASYKRALSIVYNHTVTSLLKLNRADDALRYARQSLALYEAITRANPLNFENRNGIAIAHRKVAQALALKGDLTGALEHHRQALAIAGQVSQESGDPFSCDSVAMSHIYIGELLVRAKDFNGGLENYLQAQTIHESLASTDPLNAYARHTLAATYSKVAATHSQLAEMAKTITRKSELLSQARTAYQRSLEIYQALRDEGVLWQTDTAKADDIAREIATCKALLAKLHESKHLF
jgi:eukaryotic-like serine/threonine-protein kinase